MRAEVAVAILAGGEGSRVGGAKPLRIVGGERLIDRALRQARQWSELVVIAIRDGRQVEPIDATICTDEPGIEGPIAGLIAALRFAETNGCEFLLTIPTDTPFLPTDLLDRLASAIGDRAGAIATSGEQLHPVCALWRTTVLHEINRYLATGRRSLHGLAELVGFDVVEWAAEPFDPFFNINTAADFARAEQLL